MSSEQKKCERWDLCSAPLCPEDPNLKEAIWFPDEEICHLRSKGSLQWIINQKKIARVADHETCGYFTYVRLNRKMRITPKIKGDNPDNPHVEKTATEEYSKHTLIEKKTAYYGREKKDNASGWYNPITPMQSGKKIRGVEVKNENS